MWFQELLTPLPGVLFTFLSRYLFTIGHRLVFSLITWSWQIQSGFHVSRFTQGCIQNKKSNLNLRGCHSLWRCFPATSLRKTILFLIFYSNKRIHLITTHTIILPVKKWGYIKKSKLFYQYTLFKYEFWALSLSLAATQKIEYSFFSSAY